MTGVLGITVGFMIGASRVPLHLFVFRVGTILNVGTRVKRSRSSALLL